MALDVDKVWPYHIYKRNSENYACTGRYALYLRDETFDLDYNTYDYCGETSDKFTKLADREWVEW